MSADLSFRRATLADVERLLTYVHSAYRGEVSRKGWTTEADLLDGQRTDVRELKELVSGDGAQMWLLERGPELLGTIVLKREPEGVVHLGMIAVAPEQQGKGAGRVLLEQAEQVVREQAWGTRLEMTVIGQRAELIAWYERRGFRVTGEQRPFPYGDTRFGLPKVRDLYFIVLAKDL
ncbi:MAG TPA: GNAT family N-acetyltransferase [Polyangiales bacterium]|jgi:ribosomal protein S18 acetylase RimI-like enzyme|nr:GNAT family N-acetyltransferase [Polyangiales bacterium]